MWETKRYEQRGERLGGKEDGVEERGDGKDGGTFDATA